MSPRRCSWKELLSLNENFPAHTTRDSRLNVITACWNIIFEDLFHPAVCVQIFKRLKLTCWFSVPIYIKLYTYRNYNCATKVWNIKLRKCQRSICSLWLSLTVNCSTNMFLWWSYFGCLDKVSINHVCLISFAFISYSINVDHIALSIKCKLVHAYMYIYLHMNVLHVKNFPNVKLTDIYVVLKLVK